MIVQPDTLLAPLLKFKVANKSRKGLSSGFDSIDEHLLICKKYLMVITGYPSHGKSAFLDALAINFATAHDWSWLYFSPETDELYTHLMKLVRTKSGKPIIAMSNKEIENTVSWAQDHFAWIKAGDDDYFTLEDVMRITAQRIEAGHKVDALVIDPWNELNHTKMGHREDAYISQYLTKFKKFAQKYDILPVIVAHPHSISETTNAQTIPALRHIAGGAMWWNKTDIGICVYRKDVTKNEPEIFLQKVKDLTLGYAGRVRLDYDRDSGRFKDIANPEFTIPELIPI